MREGLRLWLENEAASFERDLKRAPLGFEAEGDFSLDAGQHRVPHHRKPNGMELGELHVDGRHLARTKERPNAAWMVRRIRDGFDADEARFHAPPSSCWGAS